MGIQADRQVFLQLFWVLTNFYFSVRRCCNSLCSSWISFQIFMFVCPPICLNGDQILHHFLSHIKPWLAKSSLIIFLGQEPQCPWITGPMAKEECRNSTAAPQECREQCWVKGGWYVVSTLSISRQSGLSNVAHCDRLQKSPSLLWSHLSYSAELF